MADTSRYYTPDLTEWVTHNMYRNFPIIDDVVAVDDYGKMLPDSFLGGLNIECYPMHSSTDADYFFIYSVVASGSYVNIEIGYTPGQGGQLIICGKVIGIPMTLRSGDTIADRTFVVEPIADNIPEAYNELNYLSGTLIVGTCQDINGSYLYRNTSKNSQISPLCRAFPLSGISSLIVEAADGTRQTLIGDVVIQAGAGVRISVTSTDINSESLPCVVFERVPMENETDSSINNLDDAVHAILSSLGTPIRTINGVMPDENGSILIKDDSGCLQVKDGDGYVSITNTCVTPCCSDASTPDVEAAIAQLEEARDRLINYYESISTSIGIIQAKLASLISSTTPKQVTTNN